MSNTTDDAGSSMQARQQTDAVTILHNRYGKPSDAVRAELSAEDAHASITVNGREVSVLRQGATAAYIMGMAEIDPAGRVLIKEGPDGDIGQGAAGTYSGGDTVPVEDGDDFVASPTGHF